MRKSERLNPIKPTVGTNHTVGRLREKDRGSGGRNPAGPPGLGRLRIDAIRRPLLSAERRQSKMYQYRQLVVAKPPMFG